MFQIEFKWDAITKIGDELEKLNKNIEKIIEFQKPPAASVIRFYVDEGGITKRVVKMFLKVTEQKSVLLRIKDNFGNSASVDGLPAWALTDPALADIEPAADGMSALLKPKGQLGSCKIQVKADADLGEGVREILGELDVEFLSGEAVVLELSEGELPQAPQPSEVQQ
jgi:hypothetical protein